MRYLKLLFAIGLVFTAMAIPAAADQIHSKGPATASCGNHTAKGHRWVLKLRGSTSIPHWAKVKHRHALHCAKSSNHKKAMKNQWKRVRRSILPRNHDHWVRIGRCEQPGQGYRGVHWSFGGATYQGGLGIWYGNWTSLKPRGFPSSAGQATWRQQMKVANILADRYGFSAWGCN